MKLFDQPALGVKGRDSAAVFKGRMGLAREQKPFQRLHFDRRIRVYYLDNPERKVRMAASKKEGRASDAADPSYNQFSGSLRAACLGGNSKLESAQFGATSNCLK